MVVPFTLCAPLERFFGVTLFHQQTMGTARDDRRAGVSAKSLVGSSLKEDGRTLWVRGES